MNKLRPYLIFAIFIVLGGYYLFGSVAEGQKLGMLGVVVIMGLISLFNLTKFVFGFMMLRAKVDLDINKLHNPKPRFTLNSDDEKLSVTAECFYLLTETSGFPDHYNNSLEEVDLDNENALIDLRSSIDASWGIDNKNTAKAQLETLRDMCEQYNELTFAGVDPDQINLATLDATAKKFGLNLPAQPDAPISAYNVVRFIFLSRSCFTLGYITEEETRLHLLQAAGWIKTHYRDWQQFAYSYLYMYLDWNKSSGSGAMMQRMAKERVISTKMLLEEANSPLKQITIR